MAGRSGDDGSADGQDGDLGRLLALLWQEPGPPARRRGPAPSLTHTAIARACVRLADSAGLPAVTMQHVAEGLGVTKMALYRYVRSKEELLALTVEEAVEEPPALPAGTWRAAVEAWCGALRAVWQRHPWLPAATTGTRVMGPREVGWVEAAVAAFDGSRLDPVQSRDAVLALCALARATVHDEAAGTQPWTAGGTPGATLAARLLAQPERYPALSAAPLRLDPADGADGATASSPVERAWEFALGTFLDGVERRGAPAPP